MRVVVEQIKRKLFLCGGSRWTHVRAEALQFSTALEAIRFCIRTQTREIRLVNERKNGKDLYLYPFGGDPTVRLELKKLRKIVRESRRLKAERRNIQTRINALLLEGKEGKDARSMRANSPSPTMIEHGSARVETQAV